MEAKPTHVRIGIWAALCVAAALAYLVRNATGASESTIREQLALSKEQSGLLISAFFWPYALFQVPAAALALRFGYVRALACFAALWSAACALLAFGEYPAMVGARVLMGIAQAGIVPAGVGMLSLWFPRAQQGFCAGGFAAAMSLGSILTAPLTAWLSSAAEWRPMFVWYALPGVAWALWFVRWARNTPAEHAGVNATERNLIAAGLPAAPPPESGNAAGGWTVLMRAPVFFLCVQQFCRAAGYIFFASWFTTYLQEARGLTLIRSGFLTMLPFVGDVGGSFLGGMISDAVLRRTGSDRAARQTLSALAMTLCGFFVWTARTVEGSLAAVCVISAGMFCAGVGNPCMNATAMRLGGPHVATLSALANMCGNFGAAAFPMAVPHLIRTAGGWDGVLNVFAALYGVAALAWLLMRAPEPESRSSPGKGSST